MKIVVVGATGTMGKYLADAFEKDHEIIRVGSSGGDIQVDITSLESIENLFKQVGSFDALISTAGPSYVGPWRNLTDREFRKGLEGKLMGQINLVLVGQHYINPEGSFTLIAGALTTDPQRNFANAATANGAIEAFVRAAAIELESGIRINAISPTVIEDSPQYFPYFPGEVPVTMRELEYGFRKSIFGARTGQVITPR
ncbi:NAD(P)-dependent dehydrogenase (short-subunit alcohol dehydrogenase family) [Dyadobacter sp. BE34]|uniref:NAD(P)-dependent dehydrogenase (Short-subunit alcohol dehydrogenase family) n=1 Tax=Dyadobacter fermentans TaxID=94254 RepID=A0ABU1R9H2_9BACT|nr:MULTISPECIES: short chain dehydrogenase [Dyadobacter]MDR6809585.1 NAD(P)-dependent dehydrogenase (short-subunit alcohol dehydrogenase family) [Dyadobacter fermentans]MDR7047263.1 NAD(P)-dependent dehydrogenase (short-subunit alcohol dehydrogenase family) [Dyadobacter sp. BE242]MDR7201499.1 NAD(P)-dependent dehydrogenase (short-subunit alcohol dehydrogenase family) [Dyadobacter sp. BE34]MDR7219369.1 NAD(P)-dependent dehydrogenase (short-subunit alcohol dehydrogenase family) [Dyadobacter sp. B